MDRDNDEDLRRELAGELESLLADAHVRVRVLEMLRSAPLPAEADLDGAVQIAADVSAGRLVGVLVDVATDAPLIEHVDASWKRFAEDTFSTRSAEASARDWFAQSGGFYHLVEAVRYGVTAAFAGWMVKAVRTAPRELGPAPLHVLKRLQSIAGLPEPPGWSATAADPGATDGADRRRRPPAPRRGSRLISEHVANVRERAQAIFQALTAGDEQAAGQLFMEFIELLQQRGTPVQVARSLCNLAAQARLSGYPGLAARAYRAAIDSCPEHTVARERLPQALIAARAS